MKRIWMIALVALVFTACNSSVKNKESESTDDSGSIVLHKVKVNEVIQTSNYTYLKGKEGKEEYWMAIAKDDVKIGEELLYFSASVTYMENFHSIELNRDFERILFISSISRQDNESQVNVEKNPHAGMQKQSSTAHSGRKQADPSEGIHVEKASGGITIAELYKNAKSYSGKKVKISGVVVKVNNGIMGRNWVHIQDGTSHENDYDLTVTTPDEVNLNDVVIVEGDVAIDKDFTSGYFYPVIVENAVILN